MPQISLNDSELIKNLNDNVIVNPCGLANKNSIIHKDACLRYFGIRKKSIIYNNSENDVYVVVKPYVDCRINRLGCSEYININFFNKNSYEKEAFHIRAGSYKKFTLPTSYYSLTIGVKYNSSKRSQTRYYHQESEPENIIDRIYYWLNTPTPKIRYRNSMINQINWKIYCKNKTYHCSNDIFLNARNFKVLEDVQNTPFEEINK
jgi:hypothetical protein